MKLPKIFIPKKDLEEKTKQLLKEAKRFKDETGNMPLYEELKAEFPNFTDYLFKSYSGLGIFKTKDKKGSDTWKFYTINLKTNHPFLVCKIEPYIEERGIDTSEYGYNVKVRIEKNWHSLKYRIGYHCFDSVNVIVSSKYPLRRDKENYIPFP